MFGTPTLRSRLGAQVALTLLALPFVFPLWVLARTSWQGEGIGNYTAVLSQPGFFRYLLNSAAISVAVVSLVYATTMAAGFAFAKLHFRGKTLLFNAFLVGLLLPVISLLVPLFFTIQSLGLFNSHLAIVLPIAAFVIPFTLLLVRNFVAGIPDELLEAARVDGCTDFATLVRIVLPLSKPIAAVVLLWAFISSWNEFLLPLVFLRDDAKQTITQVPQAFNGLYYQDQGKVFAALVLISLPVMITYVALQKYFERGLTAGAIK
jgi:raffinose/stachyose/melibiose transport system permease protein